MSDLTVEWRTAGTGDQPMGVVRLTNASRRNALSLATVDDLHTALARSPEATVLLGSTTPGIFCAGADLAVPDAERAALSDRLYECYELMVTRPGVVIAVVEGPAVGGGAQLAAAADIRVAGPQARWRWAGPGHGLAVGAWALPALVGRSRALDLTMTGRWLELEEAQISGFVHRVVADPWAEAMSVAHTLASAQPAALARIKRIAGTPALLEGLSAERSQNRTFWDGSAPSPRQAAAESRQDNRTPPPPPTDGG